jgi:DNA-binding NarL/FixJ family response regulator
VIAVARLIIVEDHPLVAQGLRALLEPDHDVVGIVHDPLKVIQTIERTEPDVVLLDLSMPKRNGLELLPDLREKFPALKVLVVTMHVDRGLADLAFKAGADGFVSKESTAKELRVAIDAVLSGQRFLSPRVPRRAYRAANVGGNPGLDRLTPRQLQILKLLGEGKTGTDIADQLNLSTRTIEFHRASIRRVLGIASEFGLVRFAIVAGLAARGGAAWKDPRSSDAQSG